MIAYLKGRVLQKGEGFAVLITNGVGYKVWVGDQVLQVLREQEEAEVFCAMRIRGDTVALFGLPSFEALALFDTLDAISGVGPKAALSLASHGSMEELKKALQEGKTRGIGTKKLQKIRLELEGKIDPVSKAGRDEALDGLVALGFTKREAQEALSKVSSFLPLEERITEALKV
ncbi:Holliday junction branch migration protein RuvA, partial [Patescibacteria group bacterium]|nr:Holliday junction branch migration protein RuvA [Patescibacteria group bacterium]